DVRKVVVADGSAFHFVCDRLGGFAINVGEGFQKSFRVTGWQTGDRCRSAAHVRIRRATDLHRLVRVAYNESVWLWLMPLQTRLCAVNADVRAIFLASADL